MLFRFTSLWIAAGLLLAAWGIGASRRVDGKLRALTLPRGPVRILQFYASVGHLERGQSALLCYGVENARKVEIVPELTGGTEVFPAYSRCLEIVPETTTHYTIMAEGYDGGVARRSFTLPVMPSPRRTIFTRYASF